MISGSFLLAESTGLPDVRRNALFAIVGCELYLAVCKNFILQNEILNVQYVCETATPLASRHLVSMTTGRKKMATPTRARRKVKTRRCCGGLWWWCWDSTASSCLSSSSTLGVATPTPRKNTPPLRWALRPVNWTAHVIDSP